MRVIDVSIRHRLWALVLLPLVILSYFAYLQIDRNWSGYAGMNRLIEDCAAIRLLGDTIHALQVERGATAGFLGSKGLANRDVVDKARQAANAELAHLATIADKIKTADDGKLASSISGHLGNLATTRQSIDALTLPGKESFKFYSELIGNLISVSGELSAGQDAPGISAQLLAYQGLLEAKEIAGRERGMANGFITSGKFDPTSYMTFVEMSGAQSALIRTFLAQQPEAQRLSDEQQLGGPSAQAVATFRLAMLKDGVATNLKPLDAKAWFAAASERIGLLKTICDQTLGEIANRAGTLAETSLTALLLTACLSVGGTIGTLIFSGSLAHTVVRPLLMLVGALEELAAGSADVHIIHSEGRDEIGAMGRAVKGCIDMCNNKARTEREQEEEASRRKMAERDATERERAARAAETETAISALGSGLGAMAAGDLEFRIATPFAPTFETLRQNFNASMDQVHETIQSITMRSGAIHAGTGELRNSADALAQRTERQAATLEQTAAALEQVTTAVKSSAASANDAGRLVDRAKEDAARSAVVVEETVAAIQRIEKSSSQISQITSVIDEIAFQTNLLALNAGVEAARAGEAGKGFAVVAQEVRELAQRSAKAAKEIKELIGTSTREVGAGVELVDKTGQALKDIESQVTQIAEQVQTIIASAREQSSALAEINSAVSDMDHMTQHNAAMAEETNAATHNLASEADQLLGQVSIFKVGQAPRVRHAA
jgi:methyl-accepting chemotaxis protein